MVIVIVLAGWLFIAEVFFEFHEVFLVQSIGWPLIVTTEDLGSFPVPVLHVAIQKRKIAAAHMAIGRQVLPFHSGVASVNGEDAVIDAVRVLINKGKDF